MSSRHGIGLDSDMRQHRFATVTRNWVSLVGVALAVTGATLILTLFVIESVGRAGGAYLGILTFLVLPLVMLLGLALVPIGIYLERRSPGGDTENAGRPSFPVIDLNKPKTRSALIIFLGLTVLNVVVLAGATYKGVVALQSVEFCALSCHSVMQPEYTAYQRSPHARVGCADCHIGPDADWMVQSKLGGTWQLVAVAFDLYSRPIETPLQDLRPARDTCERCHWPAMFHGDKLEVRTVYAADEQNTELTTVLVLRIGGTSGGRSEGIHWHTHPDNEIRYRSDEDREDVYEIRLKQEDGTDRIWADPDVPREEGRWRTMDCIDCHNRSSHRFRSAGSEVDDAIADGRIDASLPYIKRESVRVLDHRYESHEAARLAISTELRAFYERRYPELAADETGTIRQTAEVLGDIYALNVFPAMNVWWNTYPDHNGHRLTEGCFRCHNRQLKTADGEHVTQRCSTCHSVLARAEHDPDILKTLQR